jgi:hypothetical protein
MEAGHGWKQHRIPLAMSISSVSPFPAPTAPTDADSAKPQLQATASDNGGYQPPPRPPLPPGQGTRVDQLV